MKKVNAVLCLLLALTVACVSCKKDDDNENPPTPAEEISESTLRTYIFASCNSDDLASVSNRFTNHVNQLDGDNTDVVIITPNEFNSLTDSQWTEIREILLNGGAVVFLSPTDQDLKNFSETAINNWDVFGNGDFSYFDIISRLEYLGDMSADDSKADTRYRAIGFCSNNILILPSKDMVNIDYMNISYSEETHEMVDSTYYPSIGETLEYSVKGELNDIVDWANQSVNEARSLSNDKLDIHDMGTILTIPCNYVLTSDYLKPNLKERACRDIEQRVICQVWSVYDLNNRKDHYLIHQEIQYKGSKLDPQSSDMYQWLEDVDGNKRYYGPFLSQLNCHTCFSDQNSQILDMKPGNSLGATTYFSGFNWTINAGLTVSKTPGLNVGGSLTLTDSKSSTIPDLELKVNFNGHDTRFNYIANEKILPGGHFWKNWHEIAKEGLHCDLTLRQSWIFSITPQDYSTYYLKNDFTNWTNYLYSQNGFFEAIDSYQGFGICIYTNRNLPAPQRAVQVWRMYCKEATQDTPLQRFLTRCYQNYFYDSPFKIGDAAAGSRESIKLFIKDFETRLSNEVNLWKDNNFYGTYHFVWQIDANVYHTTEFTVN